MSQSTPNAHPEGSASVGDAMATAVRDLARGIGYADCGFTTADPFPEYSEELERRAALAPECAEVYDSLASRADPQGDAPWTRSIVVCIRRYGKYRLPPGLVGHIGRSYLVDRRIPECPDQSMPQRMSAGLKRIGLRIKRGGVPDRAAAARAGVVSIGRNGFAYTPECGSWLNIEAWRVDALLPPGAPLPCPCPEGCRACIEACPTRAIVKPFQVRMDRCIAYLTYSAPEPIAPELWARMGGWVYGCDVCQEVCPLNTGRWREGEPAPWIESRAAHLRPSALAAMTLDTYRRQVFPLFWYIDEDEKGMARWHRNAARAIHETEST